MSEWINIEKRRPDLQDFKKNEIVIVKTKYGMPSRARAWEVHNLWLMGIITHWMPLPEPPKDT